jgi:hypothetical protein
MLHAISAIVLFEATVSQFDTAGKIATQVYCGGVRLTENSSWSIITGETGLAHTRSTHSISHILIKTLYPSLEAIGGCGLV